MTGNLAQEQETYALDPSPAYVEVEPSTPCEPILAACEIEAERAARMAVRFSAVRREPASSLHGYTMASLCRMHFAEPRMPTRTALLTMGISTKADALASLDLVAELDGDAELSDRLLIVLRAFLRVD